MAAIVGVALVSVVVGWLASVLYVHRRGRVRHRLGRQLTDHSALFAPYSALMDLCSAVPRRPFVDVEAFPGLRVLREQWTAIRDEAVRLAERGQLQPDVAYEDIAFQTFFKRGWRRFHLKWYGAALPSARTLCPTTVALVESIPEIHAALFALLPPGGRLGEHRDPFAGSLRYHLGLVTPNADACRIWVDGTPYAWRDGHAVMFDETYVHSARNDTDVPRIILFCDVERPLRTPVVRALNRFVARNLVAVTASRNHDEEPIGLVNHVAGATYRGKELFRAIRKRIGRRPYYALKYGLLALLGLLGALVAARWAMGGPDA